MAFRTVRPAVIPLVAGACLLAATSIRCGTEAPPANTSAQVVLQQRLAPGRYTVKVEIEMEDATSLDNGQHGSRTNSTTAMLSMHIRPQAGQDLDLADITFQRFLQKTTNSRKPTVDYDSDSPPYPSVRSAEPLFRPVLDGKYVVKLEPPEAMTVVEGADTLRERMIRASPEIAKMPEAIQRTMADTWVLLYFIRWTPVASGKAVGPGDTWTGHARFMAGPTDEALRPVECRLKEVFQTRAGRVAIIDLEGSAKGDVPPTSEGGAVGLRSFDLKQKGQQRFNVDTGMIESETCETSGTLVIDGAKPGEKPVLGTMQMKQTSKRTIRPEAPEHGAGVSPTPPPAR